MIRECALLTKESYFSASNQFQTALVECIHNLRVKSREVYKQKNFHDIYELIKLLKKEQIDLEQLLTRNFNVERFHVWFINDVQMSCIGYNFIARDVYVNKTIRVKLDDIIEKKNKTFKFRNGKGIMMLAVIGLPILINEESLTDRELCAMLLHEIGHSIQHIIGGFNVQIAYETWSFLLKVSNGTKELPEYNDDIRNLKQKTKKFLSMIEQEQNGTIESLDKVGKKIIDEDMMRTYIKDSIKIEPNSVTTDHSKFNDKFFKNNERILETGDMYTTKVEKIKIKDNIFTHFINFIAEIIFIPINLIFNILLYPVLRLNLMDYSKDLDKMRKFTVFEMTADTIATMYGFGPELAHALSKLDSYENRNSDKMFQIPFFSIIQQSKKLEEEKIAIMSGYPPTKQRLSNIYVVLGKELERNKELTPEMRKDIERQMREVEYVYNQYVQNEHGKGCIYRAYSRAGRSCVQELAKKDSDIDKYVLKPLKMRQDTKQIKLEA